MPSGKDEARAVRLRENKRRSRERQRQYTSDLERKVRELQQKGIYASVETQTAARQVAQENRYLRALLGQLGVSDHEITSWLRTSADYEQRKNSRPLKRLDECGNRCRRAMPQESPQTGTGYASEDVHSSLIQTIPSLNDSPPEEGILDHESTDQGVEPLPIATQDQQRQDMDPPCKLLSSLTTDSTCEEADALAAADEDLDPTATQDGLPCSVAYRLLKQHATGEGKIEALGQVLREGCIPNSKGGCKVKHETVAKALVDICL